MNIDNNMKQIVKEPTHIDPVYIFVSDTICHHCNTLINIRQSLLSYEEQKLKLMVIKGILSVHGMKTGWSWHLALIVGRKR